MATISLRISFSKGFKNYTSCVVHVTLRKEFHARLPELITKQVSSVPQYRGPRHRWS